MSDVPPTGDYCAVCELCGWTLTGDRSEVIKFGIAHECLPSEPATEASE